MSNQSAFDNERDAELGSVLREVFTGPAEPQFLARMRGAVTRLPRRQSEWDILAAWSRPRVLMAAAAAGFLLGLSLWQGWRERIAAPSAAEPSVTVALLEPVRVDEPILYTLLEVK